MKIDYEKTFNDLKEKELIHSGDKYAVCVFQTESESNGVTATMITSKVDYVISINGENLTLFDIDKKTGGYLGEFTSFKKSEIIYDKKIKNRKFIYASKGLFGGMYVSIHFVAENFIHTYKIPKKLNGYEQAEARAELYGYIKDNYNDYYDRLKQEYKNN